MSIPLPCVVSENDPQWKIFKGFFIDPAAGLWHTMEEQGKSLFYYNKEVIPMVEDMKDKKFAEDLIEKLKELVKKGNVTKIQVIKDGETVVNFPLNVGIVAGVAAAPWALILAAVTTLGMDCHIDVVKDDGEVLHII